MLKIRNEMTANTALTAKFHLECLEIKNFYGKGKRPL